MDDKSDKGEPQSPTKDEPQSPNKDVLEAPESPSSPSKLYTC